ncbi:hypothetical protein SPAN111604_14055 [Sphingomonas antarctica]|uniref:DUF6804 family protein n=1 Tax=Sphingomonas antarctica TaxID=2040274 RepID=UPI0039EC2499
MWYSQPWASAIVEAAPDVRHSMRRGKKIMPARSFLVVLLIALLIAPLPMPYGYYQLLRLATFIIGAWAAWGEWQKGNEGPVAAWGVIALVYNPFISIHFSRDAWTVINVIAAAWVAFGIWRSGTRIAS